MQGEAASSLQVDSLENECILTYVADEPTSTPAKKVSKSARLGSTGEAVRQNIRRLRDAQGVSGSQLSTRLSEIGRPIPLVGIQRIESGERRVDADDLAALAVALGVSPITLLMPAVDSADDPVTTTGFGGEMAAYQLLLWLLGYDTLPASPEQLRFFGPVTRMMFRANAWPIWTHDDMWSSHGEDVQRWFNGLFERRMPDGDDQ